MRLTKIEIDEIVRRLIEGDSEAFTRIMDAFHPVVLNIGYRMTGSREDAVDIAQDTFVKVYRKIASYDRSRSFVNWIYRIAVNCSIDHSRRKSRDFCVESIEDSVRLPEEESVVSQDAESEELRGVLKCLASELSPVQKAVFILREVEDIPISRVANTLKIEDSTVRCHLHLARKRIRELIEERYPEYVMV